MRLGIRPAALVSAFLDALPPDHRVPVAALKEAILAAEPHLEAQVKWGNLVFSDHGDHILSILPHRTQVHLQIANGSALMAKFPQLEGSGRGARHIKVRYRQPIDEDFIKALTTASVDALG